MMIPKNDKAQKRALILIACILSSYLVGLFISIKMLPDVNNSNSKSSSSSSPDVTSIIRGTINLSKSGIIPIEYLIDEEDDYDDITGGAEFEELEEGEYYADDDQKEKDDDDDDGNKQEIIDANRSLDDGLDDNDGVDDQSIPLADDVNSNPDPGLTDADHDVDDDTILQQNQKEEQKPINSINDKDTNTSSILRNLHVPKSIWPVTIRDEDGNFEDIIHPGDKSVTMALPKFWSLPLHDNTLMPRSKAMQIGSCSIPDPTTGSFQRGDACPLNDRTMFVAIASYRDWQCRFTVESILSRAKYPYRIRIAVVDQIVDGEDDHCDVPIEPCDSKPDQAICLYKNNIDSFIVDAPLAVGPVFARHIGHRLYRGEYYAMQIDSHLTFAQDWDVDIIDQIEATKDDMAVLSTYLSDVNGSITPEGKSLRKTIPIMCNTHYEQNQQGMHLRHLSQPELPPVIKDSPLLQPWWAAGFSFSRGHFVVNVPYDLYQPMIFQGEEMSIAIRGFTVGYDYYAPIRSVCFHHYAEGANKAGRAKVKHFWEHANKYSGIGKGAMDRLLGIVKMSPEVDPSTWDHRQEEIYGLGNVRTPEKFYDTFGIDVVAKTTVPELCKKFVIKGNMHKMFLKFLRSDGMGIDYDKINYKFS